MYYTKWRLKKLEKQKDPWSVTAEGLNQLQEIGQAFTFKGDMLEQYELSLQIDTKDNNGSAGIYAVYVDADNYLKAVIDFKKQQLIVSGNEKGRSILPKAVSLASNKTLYADMRNTDFIEKHCSFPSATTINEIRFSKTPHGNADSTIEDIYKKLDIFYRDNENWYPLTNFRELPSTHPGFERITFDPLKTEELKFVNAQANDLNFYVYKIGVTELLKQSYNIRAVKLKDEIIFLIDGKEVLRIKHNFPASQIGLVTENTKAGFNGITLFHLP